VAVETSGTVKMRGDSGPGVAVLVLADEGRLRILSGDELVGEWDIDDIGVHALQEGFAIRAEGEEFILIANDEVGLAEEMGLVAVSPRLARKVAVSHNPESPPEPVLVDESPRRDSNTAALAFALAGVLVFLGGSFLRIAQTSGAATTVQTGNTGGGFWLAFIIGGLLMVLAAVVLWTGVRWARIAAFLVLTGVIIVFGIMVSGAESGSGYVTAYGFVAGGLVVGVGVLFSGALRNPD